MTQERLDIETVVWVHGDPDRGLDREWQVADDDRWIKRPLDLAEQGDDV